MFDKKFLVSVCVLIVLFFVVRHKYYQVEAKESTFKMDDEFKVSDEEKTATEKHDEAFELIVKGLGESEDMTKYRNVIIPDEFVSVGLGSGAKKNRYVEIADNAFSNNDSMQWVYIPKTVEKIGADAFRSCKNLKKVSYGGTKEDWESIEIAEGNEELLSAKIRYNRPEPTIMDYLH